MTHKIPLKKPSIHESWLQEIGDEFDKPYMQELRAFLVGEKSKGKVIYPSSKDIFSSIRLTNIDRIKVVIIGQDPYHGPGQAHGLSFSVKPGIKIPPSLRNIFLELREDCGIPYPESGFLMPWAEQGVLLLNSVLSVEKGIPGSHANKGWERFTDRLIKILNDKENLVFLLWGNYASQKGKNIDKDKHLVLKAAHPSPFSVQKGFFGCKHFSKANNFLIQKGIGAINWAL